MNTPGTPTRRTLAITQPGLAEHTPLFGAHYAGQGCAGSGSTCTSHPDCPHISCASHPDQAEEGWVGIDHSDWHTPQANTQQQAERSAYWMGFLAGWACCAAAALAWTLFFL